MNGIAKAGVGLLLALSLGGCGFGSILDNDRGDRGQPFPANYKTELPAFFRSYLRDPVAIRDAVVAEPVQRNVGGQPRYISCLKFNPRDADGNYRGVRDYVVMFRDGRLDRVVDEAGDLCAGATYGPFPELMVMIR